jgi:hypothetical protein
VPLQDLDGDNRRMLQLIVGYLSVEDLDGAVIAGISKQRESAPVVANRPDCFAVEPHRLVRPIREIQVVPEQSLVVAADDQVVATRMDIKRRNPREGEKSVNSASETTGFSEFTTLRQAEQP